MFYGGLILAVIVALWFIRRSNLSAVDDLRCLCSRHRARLHVRGTFRLFLARLLLRPASSGSHWWTLTFTDPFAATNVGTPLGIPLYPTQLFEAGAELLILIVLLVSERKAKPYPGRTFWLYMLLYAVSRFIIEFYRGDERGSVGIFSTSQFISLFLAPLAVGMLVYLARAQSPEPKTSRKKRAA